MPPRLTRSRAAQPPRIAVIGGLTMDMVLETERIPEQGESMDSLSWGNYPGGKGGNTAVATYRASHKKPRADGLSSPSAKTPTKNEKEDDLASSCQVQVYMNGCVGNDEFGTELQEQLKVSNIDTSGVHVDSDMKTGACVVLVEIANGESRNIGHPGANNAWSPRVANSVECLAGGKRPDLVIAHLEHPREVIEQVLQTASRRGVDTLLNPSPASYLVTTLYKSVTHLIMNETEAATLSGRSSDEYKGISEWQRAAEYFLELGVKNVVLTLGKEGAYYATAEGKTGKIDAVPNVKVVDSTGAGDTFTGMYAVEYVLQNQTGDWDIAKAIEHACRSSARTIQALGCQSAIPWLDEIDEDSV